MTRAAARSPGPRMSGTLFRRRTIGVILAEGVASSMQALRSISAECAC